MLLVVFGALSEMGKKMRKHIVDSGFKKIDKYNYTVNPLLTEKYETRDYVSEEFFYENTDSLFRYEIGGIHVGFNHEQISDAVCDKTNRLLTLSTTDISFLAEIKKVYGDKVRMVYVYIDDATLKSITDNYDEDESRRRNEIGAGVKQSYLQYQHIFDYVVMYGGENSIFNSENLCIQFDNIIAAELGEEQEEIRYADVFVSCPYGNPCYEQICSALSEKGISVFDSSQLSMGTNWNVAIRDAIQKAKIMVSVITVDGISNEEVSDKILFALESAENSGTLIIPVFENGVDFADDAKNIREKVEFLSAVFIEKDLSEGVADRLANKIYKILSAETTLKMYTKQVNDYLYLKLYSEAKKYQMAHLNLCKQTYMWSDGKTIGAEAVFLSYIKFISILLDMKQYEEALENSIEALNNATSDDNEYCALVDQFALCCAYMKMDLSDVRELALKQLDEFAMYEYNKCSQKMHHYLQQQLDNILDRFKNAVAIVETNLQTVNTNEETDRVDEKIKIAQCGELAIKLFEEIIQENSKTRSRQDLVIGYERILNYCKHFGLNGEVATKCISRIAELNAADVLSQASENSNETEALKIYLGQVLPQSGEYDVFLSFKSEDEALASKVYEFLTQNGKEVFFSKETLPKLGRSEYEDKIFEALERSRHMVLVGSNPEYFKTPWVKTEWSTFARELREGGKKGELLLLLQDDIARDKDRLPIQLRDRQIVKMSEFRTLLSYLKYYNTSSS